MPVGIDKAGIESLTPHRAPFLLIDAIDRVDLEGKRLRATRLIDAGDAVFRGHFPGDPIYPGVMQIEMMGQAASCLASLLAANSVDTVQVAAPARLRVIRVHRALMLDGVAPGDTVTVCAAIVDQDDLAASAAGQVYVDDRLCSVCLLEACFMD